MTDAPDEALEKHHWIVMFTKGGKLYTYLYRTEEYMAGSIKKFYDAHAKYPYRVWVMVNDEIEKVEIQQKEEK